MKPNAIYLNESMEFWANIRTIGQEVGYTERGTHRIKIPTLADVGAAYEKIGMSSKHLLDSGQRLTSMGSAILDYLAYRAQILNEEVEPRLMDSKRAKKTFEALYRRLSPSCPIPKNKQKGPKRAPAYLTGIVNMLIEDNAEGWPCNYDPRQLTTFTRKCAPLRTLARRVDGAFPGVVNPVAVWEIKEYYYTTTFGSRVADGVYETLLDGMELQELRDNEGVEVNHYLMIDDHYTWWDCGRSYLCRIIDMLHMGWIDEALFGYEVVERLPDIVKEWVAAARERPE